LTKVALDNAQLTYSQAKSNVDINISQKRIESTNINIRDLQKDIEKTLIKTPIQGTVTLVNAKNGEVLANNGILLNIEDLDNKIVKAFVSENEINRIKIGQIVEITGTSIKGKTFAGEVSYIAPGTIRQDASKNVKVEVKIKLKDNVVELRPGFNVNLEIKTASRENVLLVPFEAINTDPDGKKYVNVIEMKERKASKDSKKVYIKTGVEGDITVEVIDGDLVAGQALQVQTN
jgi:HlyD family secretion protein